MAAVSTSTMCSTINLNDDAERRRRRITLACAYCRYRKIRCDGAAVCKNCAEGSWRCEYVKVSAEENRAARERKAISKARQTKPASGPIGSPSDASQSRARRNASKRSTKSRADSDDSLSPADSGYGSWSVGSAHPSPYSPYTPSVLQGSTHPPSLSSTASPSPASSTFFETVSPYPPPPPLTLSGHQAYELAPLHEAVWSPPSPPSDYEDRQQPMSAQILHRDMSAFKMYMDPAAAAAAAAATGGSVVTYAPYEYEGHEAEVQYAGAGHSMVVPISIAAPFPLTPLPTPTGEQVVFPHPAFIVEHEVHPQAAAHIAHPGHVLSEHAHPHAAGLRIDASRSPMSMSMHDIEQFSPRSHDEYVVAQPLTDWASAEPMYACSSASLVSSDGYHHASPVHEYESLVPIPPNGLHAHAGVGGHETLASPICEAGDVFGEATLVALH